MTNQQFMRWGVAVAVLLGGPGLAWSASEPTAGAGSAAPTSAPATAPASQAAASRPASEIILVKVGDKPSGVITQEEFNAYFFDGPQADFERSKVDFMRSLVERKWMLLYIEDHPELNVPATVREDEELVKKRENLKSDADFDAWLREKRMTLEVWRRWRTLTVARARLREIGEKRAADEELLKKMFDAAPAEFNGTRLAVRQILIGSAVYDTPAEKTAKRAKAAKLQEDLVSGKVKWEDGIKQSTHSSKRINGNLPSFTRHEGMTAEIATAAFKLELQQFSAVLETPFGFHILQLIRRDPSDRSFEESKAEMKQWLRAEPYIKAIHESMEKYPVTGIQAPETPTRPSYLPEIIRLSTPPVPPLPTSRPTTRPAPLRPTSRPGVAPPGLRPQSPRPATRPVPARPTTRPGMTRPQPMRPTVPATNRPRPTATAPAPR